jgi:hypothetical protein
MAGKVIVIGVLLIFAASLLVSKQVQAMKSKSNSVIANMMSSLLNFVQGL